MHTAALSPLQMVKNFIPKTTSPEEPMEPGAELIELRRRIAELESRQSKPKPRTARKKRS